MLEGMGPAQVVMNECTSDPKGLGWPSLVLLRNNTNVFLSWQDNAVCVIKTSVTGEVANSLKVNLLTCFITAE